MQERSLRHNRTQIDTVNTILLSIIIGLVFLLSNVTFILVAVLCNIFSQTDFGDFQHERTLSHSASSSSLGEERSAFLNYTELHLTARYQVFSTLPKSALKNKQWYRRTSRLPLVRCDALMEIHNHVASGWTKMVHRARLRDGRVVALKRLDPEGYDMRQCLAQKRSFVYCSSRGAVKFFKELHFLQHLQHPNIIRLLGFCIPASKNAWQPHQLFSVTELGEPIDLVSLLQKSWDNRLRIFLGLARLLKYLAASPLGSLALKDFRRQQFVLVEGELKLSDLDDLDPSLPSCRSNLDCASHLNSPTDFLTSSRLTCQAARCINYNDNCNLRRAANQFAFLLRHGAPDNLRVALASLWSTMVPETVNNISSDILYEKLLDIVQMYTKPLADSLWRARGNGSNPLSYMKMVDTDLSGLHDYVCSHTMADSMCSITTRDEYEATDICDKDDHCRGFVMAERRSWSGRRVVILKNGIGPGTFRKNFAFYRKPVKETF